MISDFGAEIPSEKSRMIPGQPRSPCCCLAWALLIGTMNCLVFLLNLLLMFVIFTIVLLPTIVVVYFGFQCHSQDLPHFLPLFHPICTEISADILFTAISGCPLEKMEVEALSGWLELQIFRKLSGNFREIVRIWCGCSWFCFSHFSQFLVAFPMIHPIFWGIFGAILQDFAVNADFHMWLICSEPSHSEHLNSSLIS
uniref:Uncharacterized protein n=1 Tax=Junco hyemalis TaxID=40217 RepID=A0A8C5J704_JUNHY